MTFLAVVLQVVAVVALLHLLCLVVVVRPDGIRGITRTARTNVRTVAPTAAVLGGVLAVNGVIRDIGVGLSWIVGMNVTGYIHTVEGRFVADLQSLATPELTAYFSFVYVFGYVFLLTFPLVAYAIYDDVRPLYTTLLAYILNYVLGLGCYILIVAYGPRNFMPELVSSLLFTSWPQSQLLASQVNANTNVFPSLHTSLAATVAIVAYRFRGAYPRWTPIAGFLAASIAISTMYLGIHWLTDVVAGVALAVVSVVLAGRLADRVELDARIRRAGRLNQVVPRWLRHRR